VARHSVVPAPLNYFFISITKIIDILLNTYLVRDAAHLDVAAAEF